VKKQIPEKVRRGDLEAGENLRDVKLFPESQLTPPKDFDSHEGHPLTNARADAVSNTLATEIGKSPSHPNRMSWS
jgi:hypothetical protein